MLNCSTQSPLQGLCVLHQGSAEILLLVPVALFLCFISCRALSSSSWKVLLTILSPTRLDNEIHGTSRDTSCGSPRGSPHHITPKGRMPLGIRGYHARAYNACAYYALGYHFSVAKSGTYLFGFLILGPSGQTTCCELEHCTACHHSDHTIEGETSTKALSLRWLYQSASSILVNSFCSISLPLSPNGSTDFHWQQAFAEHSSSQSHSIHCGPGKFLSASEATISQFKSLSATQVRASLASSSQPGKSK